MMANGFAKCDAPEATLTASRAGVLAIARSWRGTPYCHQQSAKHLGADCLGLVRGVWREIYGAEPEVPPCYSKDWAEAAGQETLLAACRRHLTEVPRLDYKPGDVLLFRYWSKYPAKHLGIATENGGMIHASEGMPVSELQLTPWWSRRIVAAFAFPDLGP